MRLERFVNVARSFLNRPFHRAARSKTDEIEILIGVENLVERNNDLGVFVGRRDFHTEEPAVISAEIDDLNVAVVIGRAEIQLLRVRVERRSVRMNLVGKKNGELVHLVSFEFRPDIGKRTVAPRILGLFFDLCEFAGHAPAGRFNYGEFRIRNAARKILNVRLLREFNRFKFVDLREVPNFNERALEAEALHLLDADSGIVERLERLNALNRLGGRRREDFPFSVDYFRLKERRLVEMIETVAVVARNFDREEIRSFFGRL